MDNIEVWKNTVEVFAQQWDTEHDNLFLLTLATSLSIISWLRSLAYSSAMASEASCVSLGFMSRAMWMNLRMNFVFKYCSFLLRVLPWRRGSYFS